jgi:hypothetical protein
LKGLFEKGWHVGHNWGFEDISLNAKKVGLISIRDIEG